MALWDWALEAYARPGARQACLVLQDDHGQNVSFLLWAAWARVSDPARLAQAAGIARRWQSLALAPLRSVRRGLKPPFPGVPDAAREALRETVMAAELHAERALLQSLEALGDPGAGDAPPLQLLQGASAAWGNPAPANALAALAAALG